MILFKHLQLTNDPVSTGLWWRRILEIPHWAVNVAGGRLCTLRVQAAILAHQLERRGRSCKMLQQQIH